MSERPVPHGYYAMTVRELHSFISDLGLAPAYSGAKIMVEIDGQRFPVIKMTREPGYGGAVVLRVPPRHEER